VVDGIKSLNAGAMVSFKLTSIKMPRYQGKLQGKITLATGSQDAAQLIDSGELDFFTTKAFEFEGFTLQQGSQVASALTSLSVSFVKPINLALKISDLLVLTLPPGTYSFNSTSPCCRLNNLA